MTHWKNLRVHATGEKGDGTSLGSVMEDFAAGEDDRLRHAEVENGKITHWDHNFLSVDGEDPDWDTPHVDADWSGFQEAYDNARSR